MFYISADITIRSKLDFEDTLAAVARALQIPEFVKDTSGRWEEQEVYVCHCFGLQFAFGHPVGEPEDQYGLSIDSTGEGMEYDGREKEVDATQYVLLLLGRLDSLEATADYPRR